MHRTRVLVVDASGGMGRALTRSLACAPDLEVLHMAGTVAGALQGLRQFAPDVVVLDSDMQYEAEVDLLTAMWRHTPTLPVVVTCELSPQGAAATLNAIARGAADWQIRPPAGTTLRAELAAQLVAKVRAIARARQARGAGIAPARIGLAVGTAPVRLVVVGVSTGGPQALTQVLAQLPADFAVPVLVVQHMPRLFTRSLADNLDRACAIGVCEAEAGMAVVGGQVYLAPGDHHMEVARVAEGHRIVLHQGPLENWCRPAADTLFRSAAACFRDGVLGVVMTGMGHDGLRGSEAITLAGGSVIAQDEQTSVVWGMPGSVTRAGLASAVVPLPELAASILQRVAVGRPAWSSAGSGR